MDRTRLTPKQILSGWAEKNDKTPTHLMRELPCSYDHAWRLIHDPAYTIGSPTILRLLFVYGEDGPGMAIIEAMRDEFNSLYNVRKSTPI